MAITDAVDAKLDLSNTKAAKKVDRMLDDAVEDSFPASDPVALAMPRQRIEKNPLRAAAESNTWFLLAGGLLAVIALIALRR
jgi:hypothetical protein